MTLHQIPPPSTGHNVQSSIALLVKRKDEASTNECRDGPSLKDIISALALAISKTYVYVVHGGVISRNTTSHVGYHVSNDYLFLHVDL